MLTRLSIGGNPNLGVYARATEEFLFITNQATAKEVKEIAAALEVEAVPLALGGTRLIGNLLAANSHGLVVSDIATPRELELLEATGLNVVLLEETLNAAGNTFLVNDHGGVVGPDYPPQVLATIQDALRIPLAQASLAGLVTVGMAAAATNRGLLVHPKATPEEREALRRVLRVDVMPGTVNHGTALIGAGLVANTKGAAMGSPTTGVEIGRIDESLGYLDAAAARDADSAHRTV